MAWIPYEDAVMISGSLLLGGTLAAPARNRIQPALGAIAREAGIIMALYSLWQRAGRVDVFGVKGAIRRAEWIVEFQRWLHLPSEITLQNQILDYPDVVRFANTYYAWMHVPSLVTFLFWLFIRHRDRYSTWRNTLALTTGSCLAVQLLPVAPPRLTPSFPIVDTPALYDQSVYDALGGLVPGQLSAMPSVHVAWAVLIGVAAWSCSTSKWRYIAVVHAVLTCWVVMVTGNHFWLDGIVAVILMAIFMTLQWLGRRWLTRDGEPEGAPLFRPAGS